MRRSSRPNCLSSTVRDITEGADCDRSRDIIRFVVSTGLAELNRARWWSSPAETETETLGMVDHVSGHLVMVMVLLCAGYFIYMVFVDERDTINMQVACKDLPQLNLMLISFWNHLCKCVLKIIFDQIWSKFSKKGAKVRLYVN